jgi:hypothetical protein
MISKIRRRVEVGNDAGATLILALIIITVVALVVAGLLSFADTSIRTTVAVRAQAGNAYSADGAAEAAVNALQRNSFNNDTSSGTYPKCFGAGATSDTLVLPNFYPGTTGSAAASASVTCSPDPNSGAGGGLVPIDDKNKPGQAILTLGTNASEDGINDKPLNSTTPFTVHGTVVSDSNIRAVNGPIVSNAAVTAHSGCAGTITSTPAAVCNAAIKADPNYQFDPAYATPANAVPTYRTVPTAVSASCPGKVVTFLPGYYDDAAALTSLMAGGGSNPCQGSIWWFTPGTYYFDFHNSNSQNPLLSGNDVWTVGDGQLLAGTPINAAGTVLATPPNPITVPGACQNPIKTTAASGVQFIFGGDSQFQVSGTADAEICGTYRAPADNRPTIAFYGLKSGTVSPTTETGLAATAATSSAFTAPASGTLTTGAAAADGKYDTWAKNGNSNQQGILNLSSGFAPTTAIPAGSVVTSANLRIVYGASPAVVSRSIAITPVAGAPTAITKTVSSAAQPANTTQTINLKDTTATGLAAQIHTYGFTGASMTYTSTMTSTGVENIDAVLLDVTYISPAYRAENTTSVPGNCLATTYTGGGAGQCAVISTSSAYKGAFYIQALTYTPAAVIDLTLSNITAQVLRFGVICRSLWVKETGAITYTGPVIEVPDDSKGLGPGGTIVYLNVYVCPAAATCSSSTGKLSLRARVLIFDPSGTPSPPNRQMKIQSWSMLR